MVLDERVGRAVARKNGLGGLGNAIRAQGQADWHAADAKRPRQETLVFPNTGL
ncbi:hypothetical protein CCC_03909 [Paramagnetospirillum magnetotacticum MS-1]|uniref:Uncharacterized protein n=1 Tax=Paramagnetospirillum magnetotacticum MS-1 TaxID=272627 RepID=A0A0C2UE04_PARME|nr:hypothetical protein CCC_03909 [Paramagnetospirillum magnetotacticum MS-1]